MASTFFYGTLLHPQVLKRVLGHNGEHLQIAPAILYEFTRHLSQAISPFEKDTLKTQSVQNCDYSAVIPFPSSQESFKHQLSVKQGCVRGTLVTGLSHEDITLIDLSIGKEYHRKTVEVHPLTAFTPFINFSDVITTAISLEAEFSPKSLLPPVPTYTYIWADNTSFLLSALWPFDKFAEENLWHWIEKDSMSDDSSDVDALNGKTNPSLAVPKPPQFGRHLRSQFSFDKDYVNMNNGSFGSVPRFVAEACFKLEEELEAKPDLFLRRTYPKYLDVARGHLARLVHASVDEIVMVPNATHGINTILRNIKWSPDDIIIKFATTYDAVTLTADYIREGIPHLQISTIPLTFPTTHTDIVANFKAHIKSISRSLNSKLVAIIDSISSEPGCLLPWKELVHICRQENIISIVDGAHSIGQELNINMDEAQPDFWVSSCHKWLFTKRGCAVLYVPRRNQHLIRSSIPTSWNYIPANYQGLPPATPNNFVAQFDRNGTTDLIPFLSVLSALEFRENLGGEEHINSYCHELAMKGGRRLAKLLGTEMFPEELTLNMTNVRLPLTIPDNFPTETLRVMRTEMEDKLMYEWVCIAAVFVHDKKWWTRCSAQVFNDLEDFDHVAKALKAICNDMSEKYT